MKIRTLIVLLLIGLFAFNNIDAQKRFKKFFNKKGYKAGFFNGEDGHPFMEFSYGVSEYKHKSFSSDFAKTGTAEIKLGYRMIEDLDDNIISLQDNYLFFSDNTVDLKDKDADGLKSELLSFGFGFRDAYGYRFGMVDVIPYSGAAISWNRLNMKDYPDTLLSPSSIVDSKILDRYNHSIRFGQKVEGGISVSFNEFISVNAGYEATVLFPRYLTWKHLGSTAIELVGLGIVDEFVNEVADASPIAAPVVNFILKNAVTYGFYIWQRDKMNAPFNTERPLTYETVKFGLTFTF